MESKRKFAYSEFLSSGNWIPVNKLILKKFGLPDALMIGFLFERLNYWRSVNQLIEIDGQEYFYCLVRDAEEQLGFSDKTQANILRKLSDCGIVVSKRMGLPAKRYISINEDVLEDFLFGNGETRYGKTPDKIRRNSETVHGETPKLSYTTEITSTDISSTEISYIPPLPPKGDLIWSYTDNQILKELLCEFIDMRKKKKKPMTDRAITMALKKLDKLSNGDNEKKISIVEQSIYHCWDDFYEIKKDNIDNAAQGHVETYEEKKARIIANFDKEKAEREKRWTEV